MPISKIFPVFEFIGKTSSKALRKFLNFISVHVFSYLSQGLIPVMSWLPLLSFLMYSNNFNTTLNVLRCSHYMYVLRCS